MCVVVLCVVCWCVAYLLFAVRCSLCVVRCVVSIGRCVLRVVFLLSVDLLLCVVWCGVCR